MGVGGSGGEPQDIRLSLCWQGMPAMNESLDAAGWLLLHCGKC